MRKTNMLAAVSLAAAIGTAAVVPALAQGTGRSLDIDASIRSAGWGGACNAVFWGGDPNEWANPALLGYHAGIRYSWGKTQLVPGLANDVFFKTEEITIGMGGLGIAVPGNLNGYGSALLDYGRSTRTDNQGNPIGTFRSFERIRSWGMGVSLAELVASAWRKAGEEPPAFLRYGDVAVGYNDKHVLIALDPGTGGGVGQTGGRDFGFLVRATPINTLDPRVPSSPSPGLPLRVDLCYGRSTLNYNDALVTFISEDAANPLSRISRNGVAARAALGITESLRGTLGGSDWLARSLSPLVSVGFAVDGEHITAGDQGPGFDVHRWGGELSVANVLHLRLGDVSDKLSDIRGGTSGYGVGFSLAGCAGFRYDHATIPQARGLEKVKRKGFTFFVDPFRVAEELAKRKE